MLKLPVSKVMSTMIAVAGRMAPTMKLTNARIPPRRLRLFVRLIPKNPNRKANDKHHRVRVSATFRYPPHQPKEKPVATKPNVAKNIAKSDIQSKESLLCFVREITESERRNNRLSMAGPATTAMQNHARVNDDDADHLIQHLQVHVEHRDVHANVEPT